MAVLEHLEPKAVFHWFESLCHIPHGSRHTKAVSDWIVSFAKERGFAYRQDTADNVLIFAPGSNGYETAEPVILQGHIDMVCEKAPECTLDMETQGLQLLTDGDFVRADGTTLGGDDGIAVAIALAILDNPEIMHPPLEIVLTSDEEIGMLGAAALDMSVLHGKRLLNLDSEQEGVFTVSCAGGCVTECTLPVSRETLPDDGTVLQIRISGLTGGHSGTEIHRGRANANIVLGKLLNAARKTASFRLIRVDGGLKDNAIPVTASAEVWTKRTSPLVIALLDASDQLKTEYRQTDPELNVEVFESIADSVMDTASEKRILSFLSQTPNGVQSMSENIPGLVQTSLNLGILKTESDAVNMTFCVRSSVTAEKYALVERLRTLSAQQGGTVSVAGDYPAWEYREHSPLRELCEEIFREQYGHEPKIEAIHAGLECGLFCGKIPALDCLSLGPDLLEIHTPRERMSIASVQRLWKFLLEVLRRMN